MTAIAALTPVLLFYFIIKVARVRFILARLTGLGGAAGRGGDTGFNGDQMETVREQLVHPNFKSIENKVLNDFSPPPQ